MTAYNCVNGTHMDMHHGIVQNVLRDEWNFCGMVMSDWGGTNSVVESVLAGCDLEMPGPPVQRGLQLLEQAMAKSSERLRTAIEESTRRILELAKSMNLLGLSAPQVRESRSRPERSATSTEDLQNLRSTVGGAHVLLKNSSSTLPLKPSMLQGKKIAFVGPNALVCSPGGGGSATMNPQYQSHPFEAFQRSLADLGVGANVAHSVGSYNMKWLPLASPDQWRALTSNEGELRDDGNLFKIDFFASPDLSGPVYATQYRANSNIDLTDSGPISLREAGSPYSLRVTSSVRPIKTGQHTFSITSVAHSRLWIDGRELIDNCDWTERGEAFYAFSSKEKCASMHMNSGQEYEVAIEASSRAPEPSQGVVHVWSMQPSVRLGFLEEAPETLIADAVALSNECDYTVSELEHLVNGLHQCPLGILVKHMLTELMPILDSSYRTQRRVGKRRLRPPEHGSSRKAR